MMKNEKDWNGFLLFFFRLALLVAFTLAVFDSDSLSSLGFVSLPTANFPLVFSVVSVLFVI